MNGKEIASQIKFKSDYTKWIENEERLEKWEDAVGRVMGMHRNNPRFAEAFKNEAFTALFDKAEQMYKERYFLASQRALQFASEPILRKNARQYNCAATYVDRPRVFQEIMWVLLCGGGVGYSVQSRDVKQLPKISARTKGTKTFVVEDNIEGWSDAIGVLMSSFFVGKDVPFPEYQGYEVKFDLTNIREEGSYITGGFKAPGPEGLRKALDKIESLILKLLADGITKLRPIHCHDIICHSADAVISGGVRRSALIALFDKWDMEMMTCKTGNWYEANAQRARANNSAVLIIGEFTEEELNKFKESIKEFGEPGFIIVLSDRFVYNPCAEIGFYCYSPISGKSGFAFCNLTEINGGKSINKKTFLEQCEVAAFVGTLQAAYDTFSYLESATEDIVRAEALLGVSITGWMNNPDTLFNPENLEAGAKVVVETNEWVAPLIGINPSARSTTSKPSGNASVLLECESGFRASQHRRFFRLMQMNKLLKMTNYIKETAPSMIEESVWSSTHSDEVVYVPIEVSAKTVLIKDITGVQFLEKVQMAKRHWVDAGKVESRCLQPGLSHNISNTVTVDNWDEVFDFIWKNQQDFSGISFMPNTGDKAYNQAPFTSVYTPEEIFEMYGEAALFASGLIVDGLNVFENLWDALNLYVKKETPLIGTRQAKLLQKDWIRRVKQFAKRYLKNDLDRTVELLLDVNNWHRWVTINREIKKLDLENFNFKPEYTDINTISAQACSGGSCDLKF